MGLAYVGSINLGILSPMSLSAGAVCTASIAPDIAALVSLAASVTVVPPVIALSLANTISAAAQFAASLTASPPVVYIDLQLGVMADVIIQLTAELAILNPFAALLSLTAEAGIFVYAYNGTGRDFGAAVGNAISPTWPNGTPGSAHANALIIATVTPSVWDDVASFFDIIPPNLPPGLSYLANVNIGLLCGLCVRATGPIIATIRARLAGAIKLALQLSIQIPTVVGSIALLASLVLSLEAALTARLPGLTFQLQAIAKALAALNAKLSLLVRLTAVLSGGGAYVYTYDGIGSGLGPALTTELATSWPGGASSLLPANALALGTVSGAQWTLMQTFFGGI